MGSPEYITTKELALRLGYCLRHVQRMAKGGKIPGGRLEKGRWWFDWRAVRLALKRA